MNQNSRLTTNDSRLFDVYPLFNIEPVKAKGSWIWDKNGIKYLDLYGGHAVISVGHGHPMYVKALSDQLGTIGFYSNAVKIPQQEELAANLAGLSGYSDHKLFLCNSGAEANENALKLASFHTGRKKVIAFKGSFHGRTSLAVAATDDKKIIAPVNENADVLFLPFNDKEALQAAMNDEVCAVIVEGIQGVGGVHVAEKDFLETVKNLCAKHGAILILDEIQSGCGRSGRFFAHQHSGVDADIITMAKGMGNGFPVAGLLIHPKIEAKHGMLGTTFGGNYLACAAANAVLSIMKEEELVKNAGVIGEYILEGLKGIPGVRKLRGMGLMIGIELEFPCAAIRNELLFQHYIFTGSSSDKNTLRILPALNLTIEEADRFIDAFKSVILKHK